MNSPNRKQNRVGFLLLKSLLFLDIQEFAPPPSSKIHIDLAWKDKLYLQEQQSYLMTDGFHCVFERYFGDIQQISLLFYEHEDIIVKNCCCQILTLLYDFVLHHRDLTSYSPQILIDAITQQVTLEETDVTKIIEEIRRERANQIGDLSMVLNLARSLKEYLRCLFRFMD